MSCRCLAATPGANGSTTAVFYTSAAAVESLASVGGVNSLAFRLTDDTPAGASRAVTAVRAYLTAQTGADTITALLYIITILAFASALFLISATMNTLVPEQASEIAILKTLGGRRRQIGGIILRTAAILGVAGAVLGTILGIVIAYLLVHYFAETIIDVSVGFGISIPVVVASLVLGPPAARRPCTARGVEPAAPTGALVDVPGTARDAAALAPAHGPPTLDLPGRPHGTASAP